MLNAGHSVHDKLPERAAYVPALQVSQAALPNRALYVPALHGVHVPPSGPVYPELHLQSVTYLLPSADVLNEGHMFGHSIILMLL